MNVTEIGKQLQKYLDDREITQENLAKAVKIDQSQISRIINGDFKKVSKNVKKLCEYAKIDLDSIKLHRNPAENPDLMEALSLVWNGTNKNAKALAKVIRSLKELS